MLCGIIESAWSLQENRKKGVKESRIEISSPQLQVEAK
jgi:hypothetical protein